MEGHQWQGRDFAAMCSIWGRATTTDLLCIPVGPGPTWRGQHTRRDGRRRGSRRSISPRHTTRLTPSHPGEGCRGSSRMREVRCTSLPVATGTAESARRCRHLRSARHGHRSPAQPLTLGLGINAWTVVLYQPWIVDAYPDCARVLASGDPIGAGVCAANEDVRELRSGAVRGHGRPIRDRHDPTRGHHGCGVRLRLVAPPRVDRCATDDRRAAVGVLLRQLRQTR